MHIIIIMIYKLPPPNCRYQHFLDIYPVSLTEIWVVGLWMSTHISGVLVDIFSRILSKIKINPPHSMFMFDNRFFAIRYSYGLYNNGVFPMHMKMCSHVRWPEWIIKEASLCCLLYKWDVTQNKQREHLPRICCVLLHQWCTESTWSIDTHVHTAIPITRGLYSLRGKTSRSFEVTRLDVMIIVSLWNLTSISAVLLPIFERLEKT